MEKIKAVYFSPVSGTKKIVTALASALAARLSLPVEETDITLPAARLESLIFSSEDFVVFGMPVYAGRVPNVMLKYLQTLQFNGAAAVAVSVYGNRDFDDALRELCDILTCGGAVVKAAGAFVAEHAFSVVLGKGRPDRQDMVEVENFAAQINPGRDALDITAIPGRDAANRKYFRPQDRNGNPIDIRKVLPCVDTSKCIQSISSQPCNICARVCPMGSINRVNVSEYTGICIKCGACIKKCPAGARFYNDPGYLYHKEELEYLYSGRRCRPVWFV